MDLDLKYIPSIGNVRKEILDSNGYSSIAYVAFEDPSKIAEILNVNEDIAKKIVDDAYQMYLGWELEQNDDIINEDLPYEEMNDHEYIAPWTKEEYYSAINQTKEKLSKVELAFYNGKIRSTKELKTALFEEEITQPLLSLYKKYMPDSKEEIEFLVEDEDKKGEIPKYLTNDLKALYVTMRDGEDDVQAIFDEVEELYDRAEYASDEDAANLVYILDDFVDFRRILKLHASKLGRYNLEGKTFKTMGSIADSTPEELESFGINKDVANELINASKMLMTSSEYCSLFKRMIPKNKIYDYIGILYGEGIRSIEGLAETTPQILIKSGISYEIAGDIIRTAQEKKKNKNYGVIDALFEFVIDFENYQRPKTLITIKDILNSSNEKLAETFRVSDAFVSHLKNAAENYRKGDSISDVINYIIEEKKLPISYAMKMYENNFRTMNDIIKPSIDTTHGNLIGGSLYKLAEIMDMAAATELFDNVESYMNKHKED